MATLLHIPTGTITENVADRHAGNLVKHQPKFYQLMEEIKEGDNSEDDKPAKKEVAPVAKEPAKKRTRTRKPKATE